MTETIRALLVEDNPGDALLLKMMLRGAGPAEIRLEHVETLGDALRRLEAGGLDVVLLDLSLPDETGLRTVERALRTSPAIPVVVLTGYADESLGTRAVEGGAQDYLVKGQVDGPGLLRSIRYAIVRRRAEALRGSLLEKEMRLREIHHRVKNNLQVVSSLLSLQAQRTRDPEVQAAFRDSQGRLRSMAVVHEMLYHEPDGTFDFTRFTRTLAEHLFVAYGVAPALEIDADPVALAEEAVTPCALMVNELLSNCLKHAFTEKRGRVRVELRKGPGDDVLLRVSDDGRGLDPAAIPSRPDSLGLTLVRGLARQLGGDLEVEAVPAGASLAARFHTRAPR
ncbi:MAG TPA: histidine kinase dimerization/phosphoacceptor domain -containing protein [Planctomycetota bacterium]